jgi:hypothetical protein
MGEPMTTVPDSWELGAEVVGGVVLAELDCDGATLRFIIGDEGWFDDVNGNRWVGSKMLSAEPIDFSTSGDAPSMKMTFSYIFDPDSDDLITLVREYGVAAVRNREARFYFQYFARYEELLKPVWEPRLLATRRMLSLNYVIEGPKSRAVSVLMEGPFDLRSKPVNGRYTGADHRRRTGLDEPSLDLMPTNSFDEESLFGL